MGFDTRAENALSMLRGLDNFIQRHIGDAASDGTGVFCMNTRNIILNNMHFEIALSGYMPNGTATTEGQSLLILGYVYAYKATGDTYFLDKAKLYFDAYLSVFYPNLPIPPTPQEWHCHWAVNGKQPFETIGPVNYGSPSQSGMWDFPVQFVNGYGYVPRGYPYYGEKLARIWNVYEGEMNWNSVTGTPSGKIYPVEWFVFDGNQYMTLDGDTLDTPVAAGTPIGTIKLAAPYDTFNGTLNIAFGTRSGFSIGRNQPFEGWPMWQHVDPAEYGNAEDAEQWFCEVAWMLFDITKDVKYLRAHESSMFTLVNAVNLGEQTLLFRYTKDAQTPYTEGISFGWNYCHNAQASITRAPNGYIYISKTEELFDEDDSQVAIEQSALINKVNEWSYIRGDWWFSTGLDNEAHINVFITTGDTIDFDAPKTVWRTPVPWWTTTAKGVIEQTLALRNFIMDADASGTEYVMLDGKSFVPYGNAVSSAVNLQWGLFGDPNRNDFTGTVYIPDGSSGCVLGFWSSTPTTRPLKSITYRQQQGIPGPLAVSIKDANGWSWEYTLPFVTDWYTCPLDWSMFTLSTYQTNTGTRPSAPAVHNALTQITVGSPSGSSAPCWGEFYCFNDVPPMYSGTRFMSHFKMVTQVHEAFAAYIGDIEVMNTQPLIPRYSPGLVPFDTNYSRKKGLREYWRSTPYTGYQIPIVWQMGGYTDYMNNVIDYFYDAQQAYTAAHGIVGPMSPVYVWPRYDNVQYGKADTFVDVEYGTQEPWGGYFSRAFYSACRLWEALVTAGQPVPAKLRTVVENYIAYIADFMRTHDNYTPTVFPSTGVPYNDGWDPDPEKSNPDDTGHMTAHWLGGAVLVAMNGCSRQADCETIIEGCMIEFERTYVRAYDEDAHMSGSFSPWVGGNMFYGFWAGEIIRAFGLYIGYRNWKLLGAAQTPVDLYFVEAENGDEVLLEDGTDLLYNAPMTTNALVPITQEDDYEIDLEADATKFILTEY